MKAVAGISILTNVVLAGAVVALLAGRRTEIPPDTTPGATEAAAAPSESVASAAAAISAPRPDPFRWGQLEATDYPTYVANLRAIGCPEPTIRDIISADVDEALYASKREELKRKEPNQSLEQAVLDLKRSEEAFIASLLGTQPSGESAAADPVAASTRPARGPAETPVTMPLVFQNVDPVAAGMDTKTLSVMASIRERFLKEIGSQQDPNDPAYRERWKKAQANADSQLKGMIGMRAYQAYQFRARALAASSAMPSQIGNP